MKWVGPCIIGSTITTRAPRQICRQVSVIDSSQRKTRLFALLLHSSAFLVTFDLLYHCFVIFFLFFFFGLFSALCRLFPALIWDWTPTPTKDMILSKTSAVCALVTTFLGGFNLAAAVQTTGATVEFDLVFPRNETFAPPTDPFSLVFALRDPHNVTRGLNAEVQWVLLKDVPDLYNSTTKTGSFFPRLNSDNTTIYWLELIPDYVKGEGRWALNWDVVCSNCSSVASETTYLTNSPSVVFSTKNGAPKANIAPAQCNDMNGITFQVTDTQASCIRLAHDPLTTPDVCAVNPDKSAVASISSSVTALACGLPSPTISCPPFGQDSGADSFRALSTHNWRLLAGMLSFYFSIIWVSGK